jgi:hypothetical protein
MDLAVNVDSDGEDRHIEARNPEAAAPGKKRRNKACSGAARYFSGKL